MSKENKQKNYVIFTVMHQFLLGPNSFKMVYFGVTEFESLVV